MLMRGFFIGTMYKILGYNINDKCNNFFTPKVINEENRTPTILAILWNNILGHIGEKVL
jgi:hypothetical protein